MGRLGKFEYLLFLGQCPKCEFLGHDYGSEGAGFRAMCGKSAPYTQMAPQTRLCTPGPHLGKCGKILTTSEHRVCVVLLFEIF